MRESGRYLRGFGISLLVHGALLGTVLWLWSRPPSKPKPESTRWEVDLFGTVDLPPPPVAEETPPPPEADPEPSVTALEQPPAPAAPSSPMPAFAAPALEGPKLAPLAGGTSVGAIAIPVAPGTGTAGGFAGPPTAGAGTGGRAASAPDFGAGGAGLSPIVRIPPAYPMEARRRKIEGWARVEFTVLEDGSVADIKVKGAEPAGIFDQAAADAIARWKFQPALENGKPIRKRAAQTLKFELNKS
jgi:protein TonB